ncbi:hypothetical protein [Methylobacterium oxalidis]|uniref:hypothetical protein n=1 Tax=Methylobacterium oxalidis TaxID=944322 RepID=UPI0011BD66B3|nr:hypothetical protein [Methylobacterium oxalidis]
MTLALFVFFVWQVSRRYPVFLFALTGAICFNAIFYVVTVFLDKKKQVSVIAAAYENSNACRNRPVHVAVLVQNKYNHSTINEVAVKISAHLENDDQSTMAFPALVLNKKIGPRSLTIECLDYSNFLTDRFVQRTLRWQVTIIDYKFQ